MVALQLLDLFRRDERDAELSVVDAFGRQHTPRELDGRPLVDLDAASICDLDLDHVQRARSVPVSSV